jgi:ComF family protein
MSIPSLLFDPKSPKIKKLVYRNIIPYLGMKLINIKTYFLDLMFPIHCLGCNKEGSHLCDDCVDSIPLEISQTRTQYVDHLYSATNFDHPLLNRALKEFKYRFVKDLSQPLAKIIKRMLRENNLVFNYFIAIPVPLSKKRINWRGFNQAELIAKHLDWGITTNIIFRKKSSKPQADIENKEERSLNVEDNFEINSKIDVKNKNFVLIDDVATTGSTLNECAKIIKQNGAKTVIGITVAHG